MELACNSSCKEDRETDLLDARSQLQLATQANSLTETDSDTSTEARMHITTSINDYQ